VQMLSAIAVCAIAYGAMQTLHAQKIEVLPSQVMMDEPATVRVHGVTPGSHVTIRGELTDGGGHAWSSEAEFAADAQGDVDTSKVPPLKGSYKTVSVMGLVWSMKPQSRDVHVYQAQHELGPQPIEFHLIQDGKELAQAHLEQFAVRPGVQQIHVEGVVHGTFLLPAESERHPAVLVLGGSEGGMPLARAAWLASHGYAALALCYFRCAGRPQSLERIPLEYFGQALGWMAQRSEVDGNHLAVMGTSRGGELALQLGAIYPEIKAVVAYVPANVRYPACCGQRLDAAWSFEGQPLNWVAPWRQRDPSIAMRAEIAIEHTHGPILMIGGEDDGVWPSAQMVDEAAARLRKNHFAYETIVLKYPHAGHRAGLPEIIPAWHNGVPHPVSGRTVDYGGSPEGNAESSLDAIPKVLDFLRRSLSTDR